MILFLEVTITSLTSDVTCNFIKYNEIECKQKKKTVEDNIVFQIYFFIEIKNNNLNPLIHFNFILT